MSKNCNLYLSVDVGGSQTKIIYQFTGWKSPQYLLMSPGVEQISKSDLKNYQDQKQWTGAPTPSQQAYLESKGNIFVVGDFVNEFAPQDRIFERKYENALYKVLAAVGVVLSMHNVGQKSRGKTESLRVNINLGLLLPWNEYNDRDRFEEHLSLMIKNFKFQSQSWEIHLSNFFCRPEGGGLAAIRIKQNGLPWLQKHKVAVLMFGHRNVTAIYFDNGAIKQGDSPLLGFSIFLDSICKRVSGLERDKLASAIFEGMRSQRHYIYKDECTVHPQWDQMEAIAKLATAFDPALRASEQRDIIKAIKTSIPDYWNQIKKWLDKNIPLLPHEVIIGGGAAAFLEPELEEYFNCKASVVYSNPIRHGTRTLKYTSRNLSDHANLVWIEDIRQQIEKTFEFHQKDREQQSMRLIDCFGMFDQLQEMVASVQNANSDSMKSKN